MSKKVKFKEVGVPTREEFDALVKSANAGEDLALARLRRVLDDCPEIWERVGDLGEVARVAFIAAAANGNRLVAESLNRKIGAMRDELLGPAPSRIESLAAERIVAAWLECEYFDVAFPAPASTSPSQARLAAKLKTSASRRYESALKSFALLKSLLPRVEVGNPGPATVKFVKRA